MLLASYNIQYGLGRDNAYDIPRLARAVEAADIIALQEVVELKFPFLKKYLLSSISLL